MTASEKPALACDIVMKGGITSGVVYPLALVELSREIPFRQHRRHLRRRHCCSGSRRWRIRPG